MKTILLKPVKRTIHQLVILCSLIVITYSYNANSQIVTPWLTTGDQSVLFEEQSSDVFASDPVSNSSTITVNQSKSYQTIDGFGYCFTEGSAEVISGLSSTQQNELLTQFFDTISGVGVSVLRISIGASDLSSSDYSYDEMASGTDVNMDHFSLVGPDLTYMIPILKKILAINSKIKILATPWSAPKWMKTNNAWIGGSLNTAYYDAYALYFVKYLAAMKAQGINIWAITPQNEPENPNNEPSMSMTSTEETNFINNSLGPALADSGYTTKIIAFDHNCDNTDYPTYVCNNSTYVDGAAFHLYAGLIGALTTVHNATGKNVYFTEQYTSSSGSFSGDLSWHMQNVMIGATSNWAKTAIEWNFATNTSYGPHTSGGCGTCLGAATINSSADYSRNVSYYIVAHMSKVVKPNAVKISSSSTNIDLVNAAFKNTDGSIALIVHNKANASSTFKVNFGTVSFTYTLEAASVVSFIWDGGSSTGINQPTSDKNNDIEVTPNPVSDRLNIALKTKNIYTECIVVDVTGKEVYRQNISKDIDNLDVNASNFKSGIYIIELKGNNISKHDKFVKR